MPGRCYFRYSNRCYFCLETVDETMKVHKEKALFFVFIDLKKAYDRGLRDEIWSCMRVNT